MPGYLNFNVFGIVDLLAGLMLLMTSSFLPDIIAHGHSYFLMFKGISSIFTPINTVVLGTPYLLLCGFADLLSAAILLTGQPPILAEYKTILAFIIGLKGIFSLISFA